MWEKNSKWTRMREKNWLFFRNMEELTLFVFRLRGRSTSFYCYFGVGVCGQRVFDVSRKLNNVLHIVVFLKKSFHLTVVYLCLAAHLSMFQTQRVPFVALECGGIMSHMTSIPHASQTQSLQNRASPKKTRQYNDCRLGKKREECCCWCFTFLSLCLCLSHTHTLTHTFPCGCTHFHNAAARPLCPTDDVSPCSSVLSIIPWGGIDFAFLSFLPRLACCPSCVGCFKSHVFANISH